MAQYFNYDNGKNKHRVMAMPVYNEKAVLLGYRAQVDRSDAKLGGLIETISEKHPALKWKVFTDEKDCRAYASEYFNNLKNERQ